MLHPYTYTHTQKKKIKESQRSKNIYTVNIGFWRYEFSMQYKNLFFKKEKKEKEHKKNKKVK